MDRNTKSKVSIVGAGPGDPDLITVKGLKAIQSADVILYDALVSEELLLMAKKGCVKVYVGKRAHQKSISQDKINHLIVQYANAHHHVVRLKGGDPFVFGRGYEEMKYVQKLNLDVTVIPGLSSSVGIATANHIPVTCRGINQSFWVLTGTTCAGKLSKDLGLAVQSSATVVILMGINKLNRIMDMFIKEGKSDLPIMIIENGTKENQRLTIGTASTIVQKAMNVGVKTPGIIVAGDVVALHQDAQQQKVTVAKVMRLHSKTKGNSLGMRATTYPSL